MFYLIGAALVFVGNVTFLWKSILNADELRFKKEKILQSFKMNIFSSTAGSSSGSGDTEVCSDPGSCDLELDIPERYSPPYYNRSAPDNRTLSRDVNRVPPVARLEYCK